MELSKVEKFNSLLTSKKLTIVCAESITAGLLSSTIASITGASEILIGSIVTYSRNLKTSVLGVDPRIIDKYTAESIETSNEMVYGLIKLYPSADVFVAVTGVASMPTTSYNINKEVGEIFISIYYKQQLYELKHKVNENLRNEIREKTVEYIIDSILKII
jgi:PncC family amidohydrolase